MAFRFLCSAIFISLVAHQVGAQNSFSLSQTWVSVVKPASNFVAYDYTELTNNTGVDLLLRWVKLPPDPHGAVVPPAAWEYTLQDPQNFYDPAVDSADFVLPAMAQSTDKFILQAYPNLMAGHGVFKYKIFVVDDPSEEAIVTFDYTFTEVTAVEEMSQSADLQVFPNPAKGGANFRNGSFEKMEVEIFDSSGRRVFSFWLSPNESKGVGMERPGVYVAKAKGTTGNWSKRVVVH